MRQMTYYSTDMCKQELLADGLAKIFGTFMLA
jgi:hypothetical protein